MSTAAANGDRSEDVRIEFAAEPGVASGARSLGIDRIETEGLMLDGTGSFAGASLLRLHGYRLSGGPMRRLTAQTMTVEDAGADVFALLVASKLRTRLSTGTVSIDGIAADVGRGGRLAVGRVEIEAIEDGVARDFVASAARLGDDKLGIGVERIEVPAIDAPRLSAMTGLYAGMAGDAQRAPEIGRVWELTEGAASVTLTGLDVTASGADRPLAGIDRIAFSSVQDAAGGGRTGWEIQRLVLDYTQMREQAAVVAAALGVDDQPIDIVARTTTDPAAQRSSIDRLRVDVGRAFGVEAQGELGAVPATELSRQMNVLTYAMASAQVPLRRLSLKVEDGGVVGRALRLWAATTKVDQEQAAAGVDAAAAEALRPFRTEAGDAKVDAALEALAAFLRRSGTLTFTFAPQEPLSIATVATAVAAQPALLLDAVDVVHAPAP